MSKDSAIRLCWLVALMLLVTPLLARSVLILDATTQLRDVVDYIYDDGYYYLTIAANVADFGRSTFDGITATNGYQPLWLWVLSGLASLVGTQPHILFTAVCLLIYLLAAVSPLLALLWWRSQYRHVAFCIAAGLAVVILQQPTVFLQGLEPILMAPLALPLFMLIECGSPDSRSALLLSALLGAAFLVRLDALALFAMVVLCVPLFDAMERRGPNRRLIGAAQVALAFRLCLVVIPVVAVYFVMNLRLFGSAVPVSGLAKQIGAPKFANWGILDSFFGRWKSVALILVILVPLELVARHLQCRPRPLFYRSLTIVTGALVIQAFYYASFSGWYVWPWYTYLVALGMALLIARIVYLAGLLLSLGRMAAVAIAAVMVIGAWATDRSASLLAGSLSLDTLSRFPVLRHLGPGLGPVAGQISFNQLSLDMLSNFFVGGRRILIAMGDRAGGLSFWGRGKVAIVQTEGLVSSVEYLRARAVDAGAQYLERFPIEYLVVDREVIATATDAQGRRQLVIPDPIQGRVNTAPVPTFCFPPEAVRYQKSYLSVYGRNQRLALSFAQREHCGEQALNLMRSIEQGIGLRQYSLPGEYIPAEGGIFEKRVEDRDRGYPGTSVSRD